jgi:hypothetical protein
VAQQVREVLELYNLGGTNIVKEDSQVIGFGGQLLSLPLIVFVLRRFYKWHMSADQNECCMRLHTRLVLCVAFKVLKNHSSHYPAAAIAGSAVY